jgi:F0F1-type ATP synthase assembly protein I
MNQNWGIALDLGIRLAVSVMIGFFSGLALDGLFGTRPLLLLVGTTFGVAAAMYSIWDVARKAMRK